MTCGALGFNQPKSSMGLVALLAWLGGVVVSFVNGNRKLPLVILLIGIGLFFVPVGGYRLAGFAILAAIIWVANKADMG
jgi:hypothetical protein